MSWGEAPIGRIYRRIEERGRKDLPLLSVYRDYGVVLREGREDNFNRPSDDLESYKVVRVGDLVLNKMKTWQGSLGVSAYEGIVSPAYFIGRRTADIDDRFMHHLLRSQPLIAEYGARSKGIRPSQWDLPWDEFAAIKIKFPPPEMQRLIADFLDIETVRIDGFITKRRRMIHLLEERWLAALLSELRVPTAPSHGMNMWADTKLDSEWQIFPLRRVLSRVWGGDWGSEPGSDEEDLPCVRSADFDFSRIRANGGATRSFGGSTLRSRLLEPGDMVLEKSGGGDEAPVGRVVAWSGDGSAVPTNFAAGLRPAASTDPDFTLLVFRAAYDLGLPWRSIKQTTGLQNLDVNHYLSHCWAVPSLETQRATAERLMEELDSTRGLQRRLSEQVELLVERRQALIAAAVTGELDIPGVAA